MGEWRASQRRLGVHLCRPGDDLFSRLYSRLGHGNGLPVKSFDLFGLLRKGRDEHSPWHVLLSLDSDLCRLLYLDEPARHQDIGTIE